MSIERVLDIIVPILTALSVGIPLIVKLVQTVKSLVQEKNWKSLLRYVMDMMTEAEQKFNDGATRKEWVMALVKSSAEFVNYPIDDKMLSSLIDSLCNLTKEVNAPVVRKKEKEKEK